MEIWRIPEFTQFDSTKSMMRNLPPKGVAGLQRCAVRSRSRSPRPPAMMMASVPPVRRLTYRPDEARAGWRTMSRTTPHAASPAQPRHRRPRRLRRSQPFHQSELVGVREQLVPRVDADLGPELAALLWLDIEREHHGAVRVLLLGRREARLPEAFAGRLVVGGLRRGGELRLRQQAPGDELHAPVRGGEPGQPRRRAPPPPLAPRPNARCIGA